MYIITWIKKSVFYFSFILHIIYKEKYILFINILDIVFNIIILNHESN